MPDNAGIKESRVWLAKRIQFPRLAVFEVRGRYKLGSLPKCESLPCGGNTKADVRALTKTVEGKLSFTD